MELKGHLYKNVGQNLNICLEIIHRFLQFKYVETKLKAIN